MTDVQEFADHAEIRRTDVYFVPRTEDADQKGRRMQIRPNGAYQTSNALQ
jgi:hypothetical protein